MPKSEKKNFPLNLSTNIPPITAMKINPIIYPPVGPTSLAAPPVKPEKTGTPARPSRI